MMRVAEYGVECTQPAIAYHGSAIQGSRCLHQSQLTNSLSPCIMHDTCTMNVYQYTCLTTCPLPGLGWHSLLHGLSFGVHDSLQAHTYQETSACQACDSCQAELFMCNGMLIMHMLYTPSEYVGYHTALQCSDSGRGMSPWVLWRGACREWALCTTQMLSMLGMSKDSEWVADWDEKILV